MRRRLVAVIGAGDCSEDEAAFAEELGRQLAVAGFGVVTGGLGGVMAAVSRGVRAVGGLAVGILPRQDPDDANPFVDVAIPTGMGELRNGVVVGAGEVVVAVGGEYGTLAEIAFALKGGKTVIGWRTWTATRYQGELAAIMPVSTVEEAVQLVQSALDR